MLRTLINYEDILNDEKNDVIKILAKAKMCLNLQAIINLNFYTMSGIFQLFV